MKRRNSISFDRSFSESIDQTSMKRSFVMHILSFSSPHFQPKTSFLIQAKMYLGEENAKIELNELGYYEIIGNESPPPDRIEGTLHKLGHIVKVKIEES